jgi:RNA polymerase sigma-70 factor (ECF subfamily)
MQRLDILRQMEKKRKARDLKKEFEEIALQHMGGLLRVAMKMTGSREEAEDLVQETFLKAFRAFDRFEWGTNVRAWLFRIMINTHYNVHRHRKIYKDIEESSYGHWINMEVVSQETMRAFRNPESSICSRIVSGEIHAAVENLPDDYKAIFMLADVEGFSYKEIAETVGCPIGTVMSRLHRARRMLQTALLGGGIFDAHENKKPEEEAGESNVLPLRRTSNI